VLGDELPDVRHVRFLKLLGRFFGQWWSVHRTSQQDKEVLGRLGVGLVLRENRGCDGYEDD
jgi:hypothetical protein